jgi:hypothetical protein
MDDARHIGGVWFARSPNQAPIRLALQSEVKDLGLHDEVMRRPQMSIENGIAKGRDWLTKHPPTFSKLKRKGVTGAFGNREARA